jgi:hypothetical protein
MDTSESTSSEETTNSKQTPETGSEQRPRVQRIIIGAALAAGLAGGAAMLSSELQCLHLKQYLIDKGSSAFEISWFSTKPRIYATERAMIWAAVAALPGVLAGAIFQPQGNRKQISILLVVTVPILIALAGYQQLQFEKARAEQGLPQHIFGPR